MVDLTLWTQSHPGNANAIRAGRPNPITTFAKYGLSHMYFPSNHDMDRWRYGRIFMSTIGRIGDVISYADLPTATQSRATAAALGALADAEMGAASAGESCGSPGEVANEPIKGHRYAMWLYGDKLRDDPVYDRESPVLHTYPQIEGKSMVWLNIAFDADDQLRQRMAWALSQIFVISENGMRTKTTETYTHYYGDAHAAHSCPRPRPHFYSRPHLHLCRHLRAARIRISARHCQGGGVLSDDGHIPDVP